MLPRFHPQRPPTSLVLPLLTTLPLLLQLVMLPSSFHPQMPPTLLSVPLPVTVPLLLQFVMLPRFHPQRPPTFLFEMLLLMLIELSARARFFTVPLVPI